MHDLTSNSNRLSNGNFSINKNSKQQLIFTFLFKYPQSTNSLLYSQFGGVDKESKHKIRAYKKKFLDKYKDKIKVNNKDKPYDTEEYNKEQSNKFQEIIDLYNRIL